MNRLQSLILMALVVCTGCQAPPAQETNDAAETNDTMQTGDAAQIEDPFAFCATTQDSEIVSADRTGGAFPEVVIEAMLEHGILSDEMPPEIRQNSAWRCMDGSVWACTVGANIPCTEKADTSRTPSEGMTNFCQSNPDAEEIPAVAAGRTTVYSWGCEGGEPQIQEQTIAVDAQGYPAEYWSRVDKAAEYAAAAE